MSNASNDLVLHLKLDTIIPDGGNQRVRSALTENFLASSENVSAFTESQYRSHGNPQFVSDEHFGSCFIFDGRQDYIEIPNSEDINFATNQDFTVASWIKIAKEQPFKTNGDNDIIEKWNGSGGYPYVIRYLRNEQRIHAARYDGSNNPGVTTTSQLNSEQLYHIAFVKEGSKLRLYLDGREENSTDDTTQSQTQNDSPLYLARRGGSNEAYANYFAGKIANLRIYKKALSPEEIKRDMNDDLTVIAAFNLAYPLDFDLYEGDNKESIIFIDNDTKGEELVFEIQNDTEQGITLPAKSEAVSQNNYHFELRFRPDTLSPKSLQQLAFKPQSNWSMSSPVTQADGIVSLYFLTTNTTLSANEVVTLTLQNVSASAAGGARTTRVEFLCPEFTYQGETLTHYYREKKLSVIDHRGKKNIPLHVSFVGSNRILNDGKEQTLTLQIHNVLKNKTIDFNRKKGDESSRFILYFDVDTDWGLGTKSQVESIIVEVEDWQPGGKPEKDWSIYKETQAQPTVPIGGLSAPYWVLTHLNQDQPRLVAGHTIQLTLKIPAFSNSFGQTNLYLRYENIPGYWDGTFVCTIDKSAILFDKNGNVGIGTSIPEAKLQVITSNQDANGNTLILGPITQSNLRLGYHQNYSWIQSHGSKPLAINPLGNNVGIGISDPGNFKLNVEGGDTRLGGSLTVQRNAIPVTENNCNLEIYSPNTNDFSNYTKIRFHQSNQYWAWLGYHGTAQNSTGEFVFWNLNQGKEANIRVGDLQAAIVRTNTLYNQGDTNFYLNPGGNSQLKTLLLNWNYQALNENTLNVRGNTPENIPLIWGENKGRGWTFYAWNNFGRHYGTNCSIRNKENIQPLTGSLEKILNIRGVTFNWKDSGHHDLGFIAEEIGKEIPEAVDFEEDGCYATGMSYQHIIPVLVEAIKEQQQLIERLEARISALESPA
jgi:hypothetical protein